MRGVCTQIVRTSGRAPRAQYFITSEARFSTEPHLPMPHPSHQQFRSALSKLGSGELEPPAQGGRHHRIHHGRELVTSLSGTVSIWVKNSRRLQVPYSLLQSRFLGANHLTSLSLGRSEHRDSTTRRSSASSTDHALSRL